MYAVHAYHCAESLNSKTAAGLLFSCKRNRRDKSQTGPRCHATTQPRQGRRACPGAVRAVHAHSPTEVQPVAVVNRSCLSSLPGAAVASITTPIIVAAADIICISPLPPSPVHRWFFKAGRNFCVPQLLATSFQEDKADE